MIVPRSTKFVKTLTKFGVTSPKLEKPKLDTIQQPWSSASPVYSPLNSHAKDYVLLSQPK